MINLQSPRTVSVKDIDGKSSDVVIDNTVTLGDAFFEADILLAPSWLKINVGIEGDALIKIAVAYVSGPYFMPGTWERCIDSLDFDADESGTFARCSDQQLDDDVDCGVTKRLWALPENASGLVIALSLEEGQITKSLAEIGEAYVRIDSDNNTLDKSDNPVFVPVMSTICDLTQITSSSAIIAGLFVGPNFRYGTPPPEESGAKGSAPEGPCYYDIDRDRSRGSRLQLRSLALSGEVLARLKLTA